MSERRQVATGASYGAIAHTEHARTAVARAKIKLGSSPIASVLLFLSGAYAHKPEEAIRAAVKAAGTPLVFGCCAVGLITEQDWLIDVEGAVAMVFSSELALQPINPMQPQNQTQGLVLALSTPNTTDIAISSHQFTQFGAVATDQYGHGPYSVWQGGQIIEREFIHAGFSAHLQHSVHVAESVRALSPIMKINRSDDHRLLEVDQSAPLDNLLKHLPQAMHKTVLQHPYNLLAAISETSDIRSIQNGHYQLHHVVSTNSLNNTTQEIQLSDSIKSGRHMFWAVRDAGLAEIVMAKKLDQAIDQLSKAPLFGLMFSNIGRGPEFYNGKDRDHDLFTERFPNTPLIGFYSNGEIVPGFSGRGLLHRYSSSFALFA